MRPFQFINGPWENSELPTIVRESPTGGDPHILATIKRVHNPDDLYELCRLANDMIESRALPSSDPEGGARGEAALDLLAIEAACKFIYEDKGDRKGVMYVGWDDEPDDVKDQWREDVVATVRAYLDARTKSDGGVEGHATGAPARGTYREPDATCCAAGIKPGPSDPLTKTPSAGHDDGNLRSLAEPNHQPHAVSQGWREARPSIPSDGFNCIYLYEDGREVGCLNGPQDDPAVIARANHWVGSPPSPAKTGGAE